MTLVPFAEELRSDDWSVALPDLREALRAPRPQWRAIVDLVTRRHGRPDIIVGHSGAGVLLPVLAEALDPTFVAFVDAIVPDGDTYEPAAESLNSSIRLTPTGRCCRRGISGGVTMS